MYRVIKWKILEWFLDSIFNKLERTFLKVNSTIDCMVGHNDTNINLEISEKCNIFSAEDIDLNENVTLSYRFSGDYNYCFIEDKKNII